MITRLAYDRIERSRLLLTYIVGLAAGSVVAAILLAAIGVWSM